MANAVAALANLTGATKFLKGRGLRLDNQEGEIQIIKKDASTDIVITAAKLKRVIEAGFWDSEGTKLAPTVAGLGTDTLTVTDLPVATLDIVVLMKGSRL